MLEDAEEVGYQQGNRYRLRIKPQEDGKTDGAQCGESDHIERAEVKCAVGIQPFGTVVHLVEYFPQKIAGVHRPVPQVQAEFVEQYTCYRPGAHP